MRVITGVLLFTMLCGACESPPNTEEPASALPSSRVLNGEQDSIAPHWAVDAELKLKLVADTSIQLSWPSALDNYAVTQYRIHISSIEIARLPASFTEYRIDQIELNPDTVFSVVAIDAAGNISSPLEHSSNYIDAVAPTWPPNAQIGVTGVTENSADISWSAAEDNMGISYYQIRLNGQIVAETSQRTFELTGLTTLSTYQVEIDGLDRSGLSTAEPISVIFDTLDTSPPEFGANAILALHDLTPHSVKVTWRAAIDNIAVSGYEVWLNGLPVDVVSAYTDEYSFINLLPASEYVIEIQAFDASGNISDTGVSAVFTTSDLSGPSWDETSSLIISNLNDTELTLAWTAARDDVAVIAYEIYQDDILIDTLSMTHKAVDGLQSWTHYTFRIMALDAAGNRSFSALEETVRTLDLSSPYWEASDTLFASGVEPSRLVLNWPIASDNVSVVAYQVFKDEVLIGTTDALTSVYQIDGLNPWTTYRFRVQAVDQADNTSIGGLRLEQRTADPNVPIWSSGDFLAEDLTPHQLKLSWPVAVDDGGISTYVLTQDGIEIARVDANYLEYEVNDLEPWQSYYFEVSALDVAGNISAPLSLAVRTLDEVSPTFESNATVVATEVKAIELTATWSNADDDVAVTGYEILVDGELVSVVDADTNTTVLHGLIPGSTIWVQVIAVDAAGNRSTPIGVTVTLLDEAPKWIDERLIADVEPFSVALTWSAAIDEVAVVSYRVMQDGELVAEVTETDILIGGLEHGTEYTFKVEAGDGTGHWSVDGPERTVSTIRLDDPGFKRLSDEQYHRTVGDLMAMLKELYCGSYRWACKVWSPSSTWFIQMSKGTGVAWNIWNDYARLYLIDEVEPVPGELRGGYRRFDQVVYQEHVSSWVQASMIIGQHYFEDQPWNWQNGQLSSYGNMGFGDLVVFQPCMFAYDLNPSLFSEDAEMYESCVANFISVFAERAYRRPLTSDEYADLLDVYHTALMVYDESEISDTTQDATFRLASRGLRNVVAVILNSPQFLYRVEVGDENGALTAYEMASRLSYHFWNSMPDTELFQAAADGSLLTEAGYRTQVDRIFADDRTSDAVKEFYHDYFRVEEIPNILSQDSISNVQRWRYQLGETDRSEFYLHPTATGGYYGGLLGYNQTQGIGLSSQEELMNLGTWFTKTQPGTFEEMFRSNLHFLKCPTDNCNVCTDNVRWGAEAWGMYIYEMYNDSCDDWLSCIDSGIYGPSKRQCNEGLFNPPSMSWDGVSYPRELPQPERVGLLTRIGFLAHKSLNARPIQRGLKVQEMLLCNPVPPPENCDVVRPPVVTGLCQINGESTGVQCSDNQHCGPGEICEGWDREVTMTVREKVEAITEVPGTSCAGCHSNVINGFGHALGHFSSEGRYWEREHMFTADKNGYGDFTYTIEPPENWPEIDTVGSALMIDQNGIGQRITVDGAAELADALVDSGRMEWCWSREYFRYTMGRLETEADADEIESTAELLRNGGTLGDGFKSIAYFPQFKTLIKPIDPTSLETE
ncbi:MAG: hypothetical protein CMH49_07565 [Myxococcales bacterium]|nr:hypothetical protein [Myxococcales bacterium]